LKDLHEAWQPHAGQVPVGHALFYENKKRVFLRCGRKFGKTEFAAYTLYRWAAIPNGQFYFVAPFYNQAAEIIWHPGRLQNFLGKYTDRYIKDINNTEKRIIFKNGSFIKLVGSDNHQAGRGFNPDGAVYDEFKDHDYRFHEGFVDNLITKKAPLLIVGTPPDNFDNFYVKTEEDFKQDPRGAYFKMPTHMNPYIDPEDLKLEKESAIRKGEWAKYMREIEAEIVPGGANSIFPMLEVPRYDERGNFQGTSKHVREHEELMDMVNRHPKDWKFFWMNDPGTSTCFASLFVAINEVDKRFLVLDEIYEKDRSKNSTGKIIPVGQKKIEEINPRADWFRGYDHAAAWFNNEVINEFGFSLIPCQKDYGKDQQDAKHSLMKDMLLGGYYLISKKAKNHIAEMSTFATDENGKIPKKNDHTIDCAKYILNAANYHRVPKTPFDKNVDIRIYLESNEYEYEEDIPINMYEMEEEFYDGDY
jgi:hypothetical protein